jgi:hypothetical protein
MLIFGAVVVGHFSRLSELHAALLLRLPKYQPGNPVFGSRMCFGAHV